ncbi:MAG TPA: PrsW family intramembrane metalloprotease [Nocardioidaceae bacterium]|nr:PrsW family intramembrane metalloprotease [Nocardioidaceae bacterium]
MSSLAPLPAPPVPRRRRSWLLIVSSVILGVGAVAMAALILLVGEPGAAGLGVLLAALPVPLLIGFYLWLDRYEPEPRRYLVAGLAWGAVVATTLGGLFTFLGAELTGVSSDISGVVWAPIAEELGKGLFLVAVVLLRRRELHGLLDGIVYAGMVGIGFAFTENILYYMQTYTGDGAAPGGVGPTTGLFVLRGVIGPFAHPLFTAAFGIGLGFAVTTQSLLGRVLAPLLGYAAAVGLHAAWNGSALLGGFGAFVVTYVVGMVPALALVIALGVWVRRREGRALVYALTDCARMGWLHPDEIAWTASLSHRSTARAFARRVCGADGARALREYQRAITEMGFLHDRVMRGVVPQDAGHRMAEIRYRAAIWRPYVVLPPPLPRPVVPASGPPPQP